jgi:hypothetical protein
MILPLLCDPTGGLLTTALLGLGALGSAAGGAAALANKPKAPSVPVAAQPPTPAAQPAAPPSNLTNTQGPSFLAAASTVPQVNQPGKTLLGQ